MIFEITLNFFKEKKIYLNSIKIFNYIFYFLLLITFKYINMNYNKNE